MVTVSRGRQPKTLPVNLLQALLDSHINTSEASGHTRFDGGFGARREEEGSLETLLSVEWRMNTEFIEHDIHLEQLDLTEGHRDLLCDVTLRKPVSLESRCFRKSIPSCIRRDRRTAVSSADTDPCVFIISLCGFKFLFRLREWVGTVTLNYSNA